MRRAFTIISVTIAALVVIGYVAIRVLESPRRVLRHALKLEKLPVSLANLHMRSDVWTDEVRFFYFEIEPEEFPLLLQGRDFRKFEYPGGLEVETGLVSPPGRFNAPYRYQWEVEGAYCRIEAPAEKNHVIVAFAVD